MYRDPIDKPIRITKNMINPESIFKDPPNAPKKLTFLENLGPLVAVKIKAAKPPIIMNKNPKIISTKPIMLATFPKKAVGSNNTLKSPPIKAKSAVKSNRKNPPTTNPKPFML